MHYYLPLHADVAPPPFTGLLPVELWLVWVPLPELEELEELEDECPPPPHTIFSKFLALSSYSNIFNLCCK